MNQSPSSGYWQACSPHQPDKSEKQEQKDASAVGQQYDPQELQVGIRHRTISPVFEHESDELDPAYGGIAGFISKLYQALQAPDNGNKHARWTKANGKDMFVIDCIPKFTETVLPKLFKHCKFASFVRQLNIYGFQRDTDARKYKELKDRESCRWYHIYFRPNRKDLIHLIRRKTSVCKRRRRTAHLIKAEDLDTETIIPVGSDSEHEEYYENMRSLPLVKSGKRKSQLGASQIDALSNSNATAPANEYSTAYLNQQILDLKQTCDNMQKTFFHEISQAYEQIQAQKQQMDMLQSVVEAMRHNAGTSSSRGNNNEVATANTALQPYLGDLNVDDSPKIVDGGGRMDSSMYTPNQANQVEQRNNLPPSAMVQFQKYNHPTHEPTTTPSTSTAQQVSGMVVPQAPQPDAGNIGIELSSQRSGQTHHPFGYNNFAQVPQTSHDWSVFPPHGNDTSMAKFTALHYQQQAGPAQPGFASERRAFAPDYGLMPQHN